MRKFKRIKVRQWARAFAPFGNALAANQSNIKTKRRKTHS